MWTPLILICFVGSAQCAIPAAPTFLTQQECQDALRDATNYIQLPPNTYIAAARCLAWGVQS